MEVAGAGCRCGARSPSGCQAVSVRKRARRDAVLAPGVRCDSSFINTQRRSFGYSCIGESRLCELFRCSECIRLVLWVVRDVTKAVSEAASRSH